MKRFLIVTSIVMLAVGHIMAQSRDVYSAGSSVNTGYLSKFSTLGPTNDLINNSLIYDNGTNVGIGTGSSVSTNSSLHVASSELTGFNIGKIGVYVPFNANNTSLHAHSDSRMEQLAVWTYAGTYANSFYGCMDSLTILKPYYMSTTAIASGGYFYLRATDPIKSGFTSGKTYWVAGVHGVLDGSMSITPDSSGAAAAVIGRDLIDLLDSTNHKYTYAGYFVGKGYFSGHVGIGCKPTTAYTLKISGSALASGGTWVNSDKRFKKSINTIENPMSLINRLRGTTYEFRTDEFKSYAFREGKQYGFIAQELKTVLPEAVMQDNDGYYAVNYDAVVPLLVEGMKQQQTTIQDQADHIDKLEKKVETLLKALNLQGAGTDETGSTSRLFQNNPNPSGGKTEIAYIIDEKAQNAMLAIYDLNGKQMRSYTILDKGLGKTQIASGDFETGTYIYTLTVDGKQIGSFKMVISK